MKSAFTNGGLHLLSHINVPDQSTERSSSPIKHFSAVSSFPLSTGTKPREERKKKKYSRNFSHRVGFFEQSSFSATSSQAISFWSHSFSWSSSTVTSDSTHRFRRLSTPEPWSPCRETTTTPAATTTTTSRSFLVPPTLLARSSPGITSSPSPSSRSPRRSLFYRYAVMILPKVCWILIIYLISIHSLSSSLLILFWHFLPRLALCFGFVFLLPCFIFMVVIDVVNSAGIGFFRRFYTCTFDFCSRFIYIIIRGLIVDL